MTIRRWYGPPRLRHAALSPLQTPGRDATWSQQRSAILEYLEWVDFAPDDQQVKTFVESQVLLGKAKSEIIDKTPEFLRGSKIVMPAKGELERSIRKGELVSH